MLLSEVEFIYSPVINFAMQQNHVPVIRKLAIKNTTETDLENITVHLTFDPDFAEQFSYRIDVIKIGEIAELNAVDIKVSAKYLAELTERISGSATLTINKSNNEEIYRNKFKIDLLAYDQWNGILMLPELLSTFITPNHPQIPKIVRRASEILNKWTGNPSFDEYQTRNPDRVRKQMAAIYEAISEMNIVYCSVPASFEEMGQRIRMCDTMFSTQMANCLDLSLLYTSCLEAVGIHPLLIIVKGHAFAGGWLVNESFADPVDDDPSLITKRTAKGINEICVVECTCMNAGSNSSFDAAVASAEFKMADIAQFILFIDVKRSRFSGIRPLPLRIKKDDRWEIIEEKQSIRNNDAPEEITAGTRLVEVGKIDVSKQRLWERKLLDLSLRNSLLNLRITKNTLQFIGVNLSKLEDALANGEEFQILSRPTDWDNPLRNVGVYQALNQSDPILDLIKHEFTQKRLRAYLNENELQHSIVSLYRSSRLAIEENGANTLYVALGLLRWYETEQSERARYAPILLIPVEIIKKSAQKGFVVRGREEEPMMNITLLEMLRQDFGINIGGLENLPKDEYGVDVKAVFNIVRQAVMSKTGWDVEEQCFLSTFSFSKFILWNDIHNNANDLLKNKVVASLVSGKLEWQPKESIEIDLDKDLHPSSIALPISTDSSQLNAIVTASDDESFVLHGPPGTGKSQTITNIIANALYQGKKVLFVSAKKAALDVVHSRLVSIGLAPFCLELHSNKSKKSDVLGQLKRSTEVTKKHSPRNFTAEAERLYVLRNELNEYVKALHRKHHFGLSLYEIFTAYSSIERDIEKLLFSASEIKDLTEQKLVRWYDLAEDIQAVGGIISHPFNHPLSAIKTMQYSQQLKQDAYRLLTAYRELLLEFHETIEKVKVALNIESELTTKQQIEALKNISSMLLQLPNIPAQLFAIDHAEESLSKTIEIAEHGIKRDEIRTSLLKTFNPEILSINAQLLLTEWNTADSKWFLPKFLKQNSIAKSIKRLSLGGKIEKTSILPILQKVIAYKKEQEVIDKASHLAQYLKFLWNNGECDWNNLMVICNAINHINREIFKLNEPGIAARWRTNLAQQFYEGSKMYIDSNATLLRKCTQLTSDLTAKENELRQLLSINLEIFEKKDQAWYNVILPHIDVWLTNLDRLKDWIQWNHIKEKSILEGLKSLTQAYEKDLFESHAVVTEFKRGLYRSCGDYIIDNEPNLSSFNGKLFHDKINRFKELNKQFEKLTKEELYARLASKIPDFTREAAQTSEPGILQKELKRVKGGMPIRKLFDSIPNLLPRLAPCMLMSPISVAQYFDTASEKFDLLVFDEASQLPTCEAVGAIARAKNVVVVGDPKQMPPTSFFSTNNIDEDNIEKEDLESILDDCLALSMPSKHLLWHYRSKHESLIAFSNAKYYDNKLLTFPSTDDIISRVSFIKVDGYYDKGKTRQNSFEAKAIVDEIVKRLSDPQLGKRSIGVVTFSVVQQILIEDMLNEVFKFKPELEKLAFESDEPLFIKNLENVQGDERDVILFSICYGPDKEGKVSLNFGPINRDGGWRRLNVAVSRARYEMKVYSTLTSDQIDLTRTASVGVAGLKSFLAFAEKGKQALPNRTVYKSEKDSAFESMLAQQIKLKGYDVHVDIGCSSYKIDIGIVHPKNTHQYILGILCDGANYYNASTCRDREIVQPQVLESLGWNIHKVWSTDWWENPDKLIAEIVDSIEKAENRKDEATLPQIEDFHHAAPEVKQEANGAEPGNAINQLYTAMQNDNILNNSQKLNENLYQVSKLSPINTTSSDDFLMPFNKTRVISQIKEVLQSEAPISRNLLMKRVLSAWGISRSGARINNHFENLLSEMNVKKTQYGENMYLWKEDQHPSTYFIYRRAIADLEKRDADDLPPEEIANGVKEILKHQISLNHEDLIRETAKLFGFARIGGNVERAICGGIDLVLKDGLAKNQNGRVAWISHL